MPLWSYPEIRVAWIRGSVKRIRAFAPDAIHVATEAASASGGQLLAQDRLHFTTSFHTRYAGYLSRARPCRSSGATRSSAVHDRAEHTLVSSQTLLDELKDKRVGKDLVFGRARRRREVQPALPRRRLRRPARPHLALRRPRRRREEPRGLPLAAAAGHQVVVGDGPRASAGAPVSPTSSGALPLRRELGHFASATASFPLEDRDLRQRPARGLRRCLPAASVPAPGPSTSSRRDNGALDTTSWRLPARREVSRGHARQQSSTARSRPARRLPLAPRAGRGRVPAVATAVLPRPRGRQIFARPRSPSSGHAHQRLPMRIVAPCWMPRKARTRGARTR